MKKLPFRLLLAACALASSASAQGQARAQEAGAERQEAAALFKEAMALMDQGRYGEACPKFENSRKLGAGFGALFNLSDCYEHIGRTASAWRGFSDVAAGTAALGQTERAAVARERATALEPRLSRLRVVVPPEAAAVSGLEIRCDGEPLARALWGIAVPLDPGTHPLKANAPGRVAWSSTVVLKPEPGSETVTVPVLSSATPEKETPLSASKSSEWSAQRTAAVVVGGAGVAGIVVGTVFGLQSFAKQDSSLTFCEPEDPNRCNAEGKQLRDEAYTAAHISTVAFSLGGAALIGSVLLWLTDTPKPPDALESSKSVKIGAVVAPTLTGLTVAGSF